MSAFETGTGAVGATGATGPTGAIGEVEFDYAEITSNVTLSATSEASPTNVVALPARTYDGSTIILIEFYCEALSVGASATGVLNLWDGSTDLGRIAEMTVQHFAPIHVARRLTPTAASHTYSIKGWRITANCVVQCVSPNMPAFMRSIRVTPA